jgi:Tfp pilus assembly protein PilF
MSRAAVVILILWACAAGGCRTVDHPAGTGILSTGAVEPTPALARPQVADIHAALARTLETRGDREDAEAGYLEAVKQDPTRGDAWARLAVLNDLKGNFTMSAECYRKARLYQGVSSALCCNQGYSLYLQGRYPEAESTLREAIALGHSNQRAHNNLGLVLARTGRTEAALDEFRLAGRAPAEAHANLALGRAVVGDFEGARGAYERAVAIDPTSVQARRGLRQTNDLIARCSGDANPAPGTTVMQTAASKDAASLVPGTILQAGGVLEPNADNP